MACVGNTPTDNVDGGVEGGAVSGIDDIDNNRDEVLFKLYVNKLPFKDIRVINDDILIADSNFILDKNYTKIDDTVYDWKYHRYVLFRDNKDELRHQVIWGRTQWVSVGVQVQIGRSPEYGHLWEYNNPYIENILYSTIISVPADMDLTVQCIVKDEYGKLRSVDFYEFLDMGIEWESIIHTKTSTWFIGKNLETQINPDYIGKNVAIKFDINNGFGDLIHFKGDLYKIYIINDRMVFITSTTLPFPPQPKDWSKTCLENKWPEWCSSMRDIINPCVYDDEFNEIAQFENAMITGITSNCIYISEMKLTDNGEWKPIAAHEISYKRVDYDKLCLDCTNLRSDEIILSCGHRSYCEKCVSNISTCSICQTEVKVITIK
jgi:hypothetical protein